MTEPDLSYENKYHGIIAGVDEAGRGPLAGPVVAAAVVLKEKISGINDSKKLSIKKREMLFDAIKRNADVGVGIVSVDDIDSMNILQATKKAMRIALSNLPIYPDVALVDGNQPIDIPCKCHTIVKGDSKSLSIAAASIIAKVTRDHIMQKLHSEFPLYGWDTNAGYGTKKHIKSLENFGITKHHRKSFKPVSRSRDLLRDKEF